MEGGFGGVSVLDARVQPPPAQSTRVAEDADLETPRLASPPSLFERAPFQRRHPLEQRLYADYARAASLLAVHCQAKSRAAVGAERNADLLHSPTYLRCLVEERQKVLLQLRAVTKRTDQDEETCVAVLPFYRPALWREATRFFVDEASVNAETLHSLQLALLFLCLVTPTRLDQELVAVLHCLEELIRLDAAFCARAVCEILTDQRPLRLLYRHRIVADVLPLLLSADCRAQVLSASISLLHQVYVQHVTPPTFASSAGGLDLFVPSVSGCVEGRACLSSLREGGASAKSDMRSSSSSASSLAWDSESEVSPTTHCLAVLRFLRRQQQRRYLLSRDFPSAASVFLLCTKLLAASTAAGSVLLLSREAEDLLLLLWSEPSARLAVIFFGGSALVSALGAVSRLPSVRRLVWSVLLRPPDCKVRRLLQARRRLGFAEGKEAFATCASQPQRDLATFCKECNDSKEISGEEAKDADTQPTRNVKDPRCRSDAVSPPLFAFLLCCPPPPALLSLLLPKELQKDLLYIHLAETRAAEEAASDASGTSLRRAETASRFRGKWFLNRWVERAVSVSTIGQAKAQSPWLAGFVGDVAHWIFLTSEKAFLSRRAATASSALKCLASSAVLPLVYEALKPLPPERLLLCRAELRLQLVLPWLLYASEAVRPAMENLEKEESFSGFEKAFPWGVSSGVWRVIAAEAVNATRKSSSFVFIGEVSAQKGEVWPSQEKPKSVLRRGGELDFQRNLKTFLRLPSAFVQATVTSPVSAFLEALTGRVEASAVGDAKLKSAISSEASCSWAKLASLFPFGLPLSEALSPHQTSSSKSSFNAASNKAAVAASVEFLAQLVESYSEEALPLFISSLASAFASFSLLQACVAQSKLLRLCATGDQGGSLLSTKVAIPKSTSSSNVAVASPGIAASVSWALNSHLLCGALLRRFGMAVRVAPHAAEAAKRTDLKKRESSRFVVLLEKAPGGLAGVQPFSSSAFPLLFLSLLSATSVVVEALLDPCKYNGLLKKLTFALDRLEAANANCSAKALLPIRSSPHEVQILDSEVSQVLLRADKRDEFRGVSPLEQGGEDPLTRRLEEFLSQHSLFGLSKAGEAVPRAEAVSGSAVAKLLQSRVFAFWSEDSAVDANAPLLLSAESASPELRLLKANCSKRTKGAALRLAKLILARGSESVLSIADAVLELFFLQTRRQKPNEEKPINNSPNLGEVDLVGASLLLLASCLDTPGETGGPPREALFFWGYLLAVVVSRTMECSLVGWTLIQIFGRSVALCVGVGRSLPEAGPLFSASCLLAKASALLWSDYAVVSLNFRLSVGGEAAHSLEEVVSRDVQLAEERLLWQSISARGWRDSDFFKERRKTTCFRKPLAEHTTAKEENGINEVMEEEPILSGTSASNFAFGEVWDSEFDVAVVVHALPFLPRALRHALFFKSGLVSLFIRTAALEQLQRTAKARSPIGASTERRSRVSVTNALIDASGADTSDSSAEALLRLHECRDEGLFSQGLILAFPMDTASPQRNGKLSFGPSRLALLLPPSLFEGSRKVVQFDAAFCLAWRSCVIAWRLLGIELLQSSRGMRRRWNADAVTGLASGVFRTSESTIDFGLRLCRALRSGCFPLLPWSHCAGCCRECRSLRKEREASTCDISKRGEALVVLHSMPAALRCLDTSALAKESALVLCSALSESLRLLYAALAGVGRGGSVVEEESSVPPCEEWRQALGLVFTQSLLPSLCAAPPTPEIISALLDCACVASEAACRSSGEDEDEEDEWRSQCLGAIAGEETADCLWSVLLLQFDLRPVGVCSALTAIQKADSSASRRTEARRLFQKFFVRRSFHRGAEAVVAWPKSFEGAVSAAETSHDCVSPSLHQKESTLSPVQAVVAAALLELL